MREKILEVLRERGHGITVRELCLSVELPLDTKIFEIFVELEQMEQKKLLILHRSSGSAGVPKGKIVLVCLRREENT